MKKILSIVLMITMILSATVVFTSAHTGAYDGSYGTVPATATAPVIDGAMDEATATVSKFDQRDIGWYLQPNRSFYRCQR